MKTIYDYLREYSRSDFYGMHMPGHKRNQSLIKNVLPYELDITEIYGFDDLHHADGIIKQAEERAARLYHAEESHFLVNGSTVGILGAIFGVTEKGDKILVARNCHKSVYHAIFMNELEAVYLYPEYEEQLGLAGVIEPEKIEQALKMHPDIKAVVIVSPTYDGVVSDVEKIARIVHACGKPLIVDEAHGAHFGFHPYFPQNANTNGADIVIHSVHKTLPSLTQTALLHINGDIVERERVRMYLHMLQSSSPSYILMASIDECMELLQEKSEEIFVQYVDNLRNVRLELGKLKYLQLVETFVYDYSKIVISVKNANITSRELAKELRERYHLEIEMTAGNYILGMTSVGDSKEGLERFVRALKEIDKGLKADLKESLPGKLPKAEIFCSSAKCLVRKQGTYARLEQCIGKVSMEYAYLYPPGIPIVVPGEVMTKEACGYLRQYRQLGFSVEGPKKEGYIKVWIDE